MDHHCFRAKLGYLGKNHQTSPIHVFMESSQNLNKLDLNVTLIEVLIQSIS